MRSIEMIFVLMLGAMTSGYAQETPSGSSSSARIRTTAIPAPGAPQLSAGGRDAARARVVAELRFELLATSVRLSAGHRLRVAIAGADRRMFAPIPEGEPPTVTLHRNETAASFVELPMKELHGSFDQALTSTGPVP